MKVSVSGEQEFLRVRLGSEDLEEVSEFKYLASMMLVMAVWNQN